jgi:hypothetical protein
MSNSKSPLTKVDAEAKYNLCKISEEHLQEALDDIKVIMDLDITQGYTDPERQRAKLVIADYMFRAAEVLKQPGDMEDA